MPNPYFQFQQFHIEQGDCAMKVSTDACLLGVIADLTRAARILDIGTGTGLLALMAAQRNATAEIEAIEIDEAAATQAAANAAASPWASRIRVRTQSLADYAASPPAPFDHIICNPPFFRQSLRAPDAARATARHESHDSLTFEELARFAATFLTSAGRLTLLLPPPEMQQFIAEAVKYNLFLQTQLTVRHRPNSKVTRYINSFGNRAPTNIIESELAIRSTDDATYSPAFQDLLAGFYLAL